MKTYLRQAYLLLTKTIKVPTILNLSFCFIFGLIDFSLLMATHPSNHPFTEFPLFLAYVFIPVFVVLLLDGILIGTFITRTRSKLSAFTAISLGLVVGSALALGFNYIVWLYSDPVERALFYPTLLDFILYSFANFFRSVFFVNIFFLPITFSILVSAYMGWKMNDLFVRETTFSTEE